MENSKKAKLWAVISIVGAIIGPVITFYINYKQLDINKHLMVSDYIKILSDNSASPYSKSLAFVTMSKRSIIDDDELLDLAYKMEDEYHNNGITPLFYTIGKKNENNIVRPFGMVEELSNDKNYFRIKGWAVDDKEEMYITIYFGNNVIFTDKLKLNVRQDIVKIFGNMKCKGQFDINIPKNKFKENKSRVTVILTDNDLQNREIYSRLTYVNFARPCSRISCIDSSDYKNK